MRSQTEPVRVSLGDGAATFKQKGQSDVIVANVLGMANDDQGQPVTVWLDRLVHRPGMEFDGWDATGAISTVLRRK
jgi:hypothetical protein